MQSPSQPRRRTARRVARRPSLARAQRPTSTSTSPILARQHGGRTTHFRGSCVALRGPRHARRRLGAGRRTTSRARCPRRSSTTAARGTGLGRGLRTRRRHGESSKPCVDVAILSSPKGGCVPAPRLDGDLLSAGWQSPHVRRARAAEDLWLGDEIPYPTMRPTSPSTCYLWGVRERCSGEGSSRRSSAFGVVGLIAGRSPDRQCRSPHKY